MIRYMSVIDTREFDIQVKYKLDSPVWNLAKEPLEVPYIKLKIKIIGKEKLFSQERKPKKRRFLIFGKEK